MKKKKLPKTIYVFEAKGPGTCSICAERIYTGDVIVIDTHATYSTAAHAKCDPDLAVGGRSVEATK